MRIVCLTFAAALLALAGCDSGPADDRPVGLMDDAASESCTVVNASPTSLTAASDAASASDAVIALGDTPYLVTLPDGAAGYAALRTTEMHTTVALFTRERDAITTIDGPEVGAARKHAVCPDEIGDDLRAHIHEPGDYMLTFSADGPREVQVIALAQQIGHAPDGGHAEHDGGHAEHDGGHADGGAHDGGHAEHDGGAHDGGHAEHDSGAP